MNKEIILKKFVQRKVPRATSYFVDWGRDSLFVQTEDPKVNYDFKISEIMGAIKKYLEGKKND